MRHSGPVVSPVFFLIFSPPSLFTPNPLAPTALGAWASLPHSPPLAPLVSVNSDLSAAKERPSQRSAMTESPAEALDPYTAGGAEARALPAPPAGPAAALGQVWRRPCVRVCGRAPRVRGGMLLRRHRSMHRLGTAGRCFRSGRGQAAN